MRTNGSKHIRSSGLQQQRRRLAAAWTKSGAKQ